MAWGSNRDLRRDAQPCSRDHRVGRSRRGRDESRPYGKPDPYSASAGTGSIAPTLGEVVRTFKATAARDIHRAGYEAFAWQRGYYEHVIRNAESLAAVARYIQWNPLMWELDRENRNGVRATCEDTIRVMVGRFGFSEDEAKRVCRLDGEPGPRAR